MAQQEIIVSKGELKMQCLDKGKDSKTQGLLGEYSPKKKEPKNAKEEFKETIKQCSIALHVILALWWQPSQRSPLSHLRESSRPLSSELIFTWFSPFFLRRGAIRNTPKSVGRRNDSRTWGLVEEDYLCAM